VEISVKVSYAWNDVFLYLTISSASLAVPFLFCTYFAVISRTSICNTSCTYFVKRGLRVFITFLVKGSYCFSCTCFVNKGILKLSDLPRPQFIRHREHRLPPLQGPITYVYKRLFMKHVLFLSDFWKKI
jgi:hypothetical protein